MFEKVRHPWRGKSLNMKSVVSVVLFGAIILVFALFGIGNSDRSGMGSGGGTAAVVNDTSISIAEYKRGVDISARNTGYPLDKLPADQREYFMKNIQQQALNQMVLAEIAYQAAYKYGIGAPNAQVRDLLISAPYFQENGRFIRERYEMYLSQAGQSPDEFERGLRKQIVLQRVEELFSTASMPSTIEVEQLSELKSAQANIRYVELSPAKLQVEKTVAASDVSDYLKDPKKQEAIKKYYDQHVLDFQVPEKVHARDILLMVDAKHPDKEVLEKAKAMGAGLTSQTFAKTAEKESQDLQTAKKGGDMGFLERGHVDPRIEAVAFQLKPGSISPPVKTEQGYVIIYVEEHQPTRTIGKDEAAAGIARTLIAQAEVPAALAAIRKAVETGSKTEVDAALKKHGVDWEKADEVNLGNPHIPRVRDPEDLLTALASHNGKTGMVNHLIGSGDHQYALEILSWKKSDKPAAKEVLQKTVAQQSSEDAFQDWVRTAKTKASVTLNPKILER